jgi:hypothetical protein
MVGADKVIIPTAKSTPEDVTSFYTKLGKPASEAEYYKALGLDEEALKTESVKGFADLANKTNLLPTQAADVLKWLNEANEKEQGDAQKVTESQNAESMTRLKGEWGEQYEANIEKAKIAFKQISEKVPGSWEWMEKSGMAGDPMMLRMFQLVGGLVKEGTIHSEGAGQTGGNADIQSEINNVMSDNTHAYHDKNHANHAMAVKEMTDKYAKLYPS